MRLVNTICCVDKYLLLLYFHHIENPNKITSATRKMMIHAQPKLETERKLRVRVEARSSNGLACGDVRPDRGRPHGKVLNPDQEMCSWRVVIHETILEAPTPTGERRRFQPWIRGIWRVRRQEGKCNP